MKWHLSFEGDSYEDAHALKNLTRLKDMESAISDVLSMTRSRIKHCDISEDEEKFLEELRSLLYIFDE